MENLEPRECRRSGVCVCACVEGKGKGGRVRGILEGRKRVPWERLSRW